MEFELRIALQDKPRNADLANNLAIALAKQGKRSQAISAWQGALELEPKVEVYALLAGELERENRLVLTAAALHALHILQLKCSPRNTLH